MTPVLDTHLAIAELLKPQGLNGQLKARPITADPSRFFGLKTVFLKRGGAFEPVGITVDRVEDKAVYLRVDGVCDRNAAGALRSELIYIDRAHAISLPDDAEFICDLIGVAAVDDTGREIGAITDVLQPGSCDVYVFEGPLGRVMVPALKSVVLAVDINKKTMTLSAGRLSEVAVFDH
jgi:16S rRNA processing protein RimM